MMARFVNKRDGVAGNRWDITTSYSEKLENEKKYARFCRPICAGPGLWQVTSGENTHAVNLEAKTCGCRKWDLTGMPYNHAIAAIYKAKQHPEDYVHPFFEKELYLQTYSPVIYPVPGQHDWTKTNTDDIDPPIFLKHPGRPKHKRRKGQFEPPAARDTSIMGVITCSNCKLQGHNYLSCKKALRPELQIRKNNHKANRTVPDYVSNPPSPTQGQVAPTSSQQAEQELPRTSSSSRATATTPPRTGAPAPAPRRSPRHAQAGTVAPAPAPRRSTRQGQAGTAAPAPAPRRSPRHAQAGTAAPAPAPRRSTRQATAFSAPRPSGAEHEEQAGASRPRKKGNKIM
ncbi:uncharacterized protein LOC100825235 isoform X2 [Brachypodium distachyon]|nr:uncharacterized protein LOC100825235 isoform X2 [Brachypodium distachyon]|eukprot:XP_010237872.2 uncharacterized protein LOC100825235 isoform X2 [Brachypodium distachyon]